MNSRNLLGTPEEIQRFEKHLCQIAGENAVACRKISPASLLLRRKTRTASPLNHSADVLIARQRQDAIITNEEFDLLWTTLESFAQGSDKKRIPYHVFKAWGVAASEKNAKFQRFFKARTFFMLHRDTSQRISTSEFVDLILQTVTLESHRLSLSSYDTDGSGTLSEADLELWIKDQLDSIPRLTSLSEDFYLTYVVYASRKFCFFLDKSRTGRIKISSLLTSNIFSEFLELYEEELRPDLENSNWFALPFVSRVHKTYVMLDADEDGLLSRDELSGLDGGVLSSALLDRVFEECQSFEGKLDYRAFLDLVLAREYPDHPISLQFFFRLLDFEHQGALTIRAFHFFWQSMERHPLMEMQDVPTLTDVQNEIFDMVRPEDAYRITYEDLVRSGKGDVTIRLLTDVNGFVDYENREAQVVQDDDFDEND